jgi:uncharacterized protein YdeI (YjbR/CyaY-like superfamily)
MKVTKNRNKLSKNKSGADLNTKLLNARMPSDFRRELKANLKALAQWEDITPNARRDWIAWIITAKQSETRKRRIERACTNLSSGKRRVCCFGGIKWLMKIQSLPGKK